MGHCVKQGNMLSVRSVCKVLLFICIKVSLFEKVLYLMKKWKTSNIFYSTWAYLHVQYIDVIAVRNKHLASFNWLSE